MENIFTIIESEQDESVYKNYYLKLFNLITDAIECKTTEDAIALCKMLDIHTEPDDAVYKKMYDILVNALEFAKTKQDKEIFNEILINAQQQTEDLYY